MTILEGGQKKDEGQIGKGKKCQESRRSLQLEELQWTTLSLSNPGG